MAAQEKPDTNIHGFVARVLLDCRKSGAEPPSLRKTPEQDIRRLVTHDYVRSLRRHMSYSCVKRLLAAFREFLPDFNRLPTVLMSMQPFEQMARELNFHLKASPYEGEEGLLLRGFYVARAYGILKHPLIYVNTAYQQLAISTTFCHELGHHISTGLLGLEPEPVHFFFSADYSNHLGDPRELAADIMVTFAGYPRPVAQRIFETPWDWGLVARAKNLTEAALKEVSTHLKLVYGFDLIEQIPIEQRLHYLSGMIHYAKLRWAVLAEYDI